MISRILSSIIAVGYLVAAYFTSGLETTFKFGISLLLPLVCIWYSEAMGGYTGVSHRGVSITKPTPGCFIALVGWALLLLPLIAVLFFAK